MIWWTLGLTILGKVTGIILDPQSRLDLYLAMAGSFAGFVISILIHAMRFELKIIRND